jgi:hypothetical protein
MSQQNLCFFSTRCRYSQAFLEELSRTPFSREFRFICVDAPPGGVRPVLPPYVRAVPTLMIAGENEPRTDAQVMNWLSERRLIERTGAVPTATVPGARPPVGNIGPRTGGGGGGGGPSMMVSPAAAAASRAGGGGPMGPSSSAAHPGVSAGAGAGISVAPPLNLSTAAPLADSTGVGPMAFGGSEFMMGGGDEGFAYIGEEATSHERGSVMVRMTGNMANFNDLAASTAPIGAGMMGGGGGGPSSGGGPAATSVRGGGPAQSAKAKSLESDFDKFRSMRDTDLPSGPRRM